MFSEPSVGSVGSWCVRQHRWRPSVGARTVVARTVVVGVVGIVGQAVQERL